MTDEQRIRGWTAKHRDAAWEPDGDVYDELVQVRVWDAIEAVLDVAAAWPDGAEKAAVVAAIGHALRLTQLPA